MGMGHPVSIIFWAIVVVAGVLFVLALLASLIFQGVSGLVGGRSRGVAKALRSMPTNVVRFCSNTKCRHPNRPDARFCGQCGQRL
ncbi:MAG: zinc ribbon domain-containing protein [Phycisphaerae bacterium]|nr:zinc ribbon domain-containing protein [Phycisphaerae bacterium]